MVDDMSQLSFVCNGESVVVAVDQGETLLSVLRERLGLMSPKDGCAPQGQCGCCTVWVDGAPRVSCVTPAARVVGRVVTTLEGVDPIRVTRLADRFLASGAAQCGFCTPGILMRCLPLVAIDSEPTAVAIDRALAAHLCRCTGWNTIIEALRGAEIGVEHRDLDRASQRSMCEGGVAQCVDADAVCGRGGFADDTAPRDALVAVLKPLESDAPSVNAAGAEWVIGASLSSAKSQAAKIQGRRTTAPLVPPLANLPLPAGGVALATCFVEPAYLEPDASWCEPGGEPASAAGNGGAFGSKCNSIVESAARELAALTDRTVRVVLAREDVVRLGPKRPPISATAVLINGVCHISGSSPMPLVVSPNPYSSPTHVSWSLQTIAGPPVSHEQRAPWAEAAVLLEGAIEVAGFDRRKNLDERSLEVLLDVCVADPNGGVAGVAIELSDHGDRIEHVRLRVLAGEILDVAVARSYCIGAVHMALGWVLSEGLTVDDDGVVQDLTIRSFGIIRPKHMPKVTVELLPDPGAPRRGSDAVFVATAAAAWNAVTRSDGDRPATFPALGSRIARTIRK